MAPRLAPFASGALLITAACCGMVTALLPANTLPWRTGVGSAGLGNLPGAYGPAFAQRHYGLVDVKGLHDRSWYITMMEVCVRAAKVEVDENLVESGVCDSGDPRYAEECTPGYLDALLQRCEAYSTIYTMNKGLFGLAIITLLLNT